MAELKPISTLRRGNRDLKIMLDVAPEMLVDELPKSANSTSFRLRLDTDGLIVLEFCDGPADKWKPLLFLVRENDHLIGCRRAHAINGKESSFTGW